jgi:hypothetical protein
MNTTFTHLTDDTLKNLVRKEDFEGAHLEKKFEGGFKFKSVGRDSKNGLVGLEVAFRRGKRVGFFRQTA